MTTRHLPSGTVTFLISDIEGSTSIVQALGAEWVPVLEAHNRIVEEAIVANDGVVVKVEGDSFFAVFSSAVDALTAAVRAQQGLISHPWPEDGLVRCRVGLHTGLGAFGGTDYVGIDVHRAARISDAGHGGQIILSESTAVLVERQLPPGVGIRDLGKHRLKDLSEPETVFQVTVEGLPAEFPPLRTLDAIPNNLPKVLTSFVGRERELAEAIELLGGSHILTLTGPGGTGKTRLALQVAAEASAGFPDGVYFVDLAPVTDPDVVHSRILDTLGVQVSGREPPSQRLDRHLADKGVLLVLDNFEQLLQASPLVAELARSSPRSKMLVTSRAPLRVSGEQEMPVPALAMPEPAAPPESIMASDAMRLFADRAMAVLPGFVLSAENASSVSELVRRLDGLPLAIELVAARLRLLSVDQILARLDSRLLSGGSVDVPERQRTIEAAISWSHDLLDEPGRKLFARLSVFSGGARLEELELVCGPPEEIGDDMLSCLGSLVDHSLVRRTESEGDHRYRMLHVIREFASGLLDASAESETIRRRHAETYARLVETAAPELVRKDRKRWLDLLEHDHDNIRAALEWAFVAPETDLALRIAGATWRFWQARGHLHEARRRVEETLSLEGGEPKSRAKALEALGGIAWWQGDMGSCIENYRSALEMQRGLGNPREIANALYNYGLAQPWSSRLVMGMAGDGTAEPSPEALALLEAGSAAFDEAEALYVELGDVAGLGDIEWGRGQIAFFGGATLEEGLDHWRKSIEYYRRAGNEFGMGWGMFELAWGLVSQRKLEEAWSYLTEGLSLFVGHRDVSAVVLSIAQAARIAKDLGDEMRAVRLAGAFHGLRITSGTDLVIHESNQIKGFEFETMESLTGERAVAYREGRAMDMDQAVAYTLAGPVDGPREDNQDTPTQPTETTP